METTFEIDLLSQKFQNNEPALVDDKLADRLQRVWQKAFPDATILPVAGVPSQNGGVALLTHSMGDGKLMKINGQSSKSPLANNALFSTEVSDGKYLNLYEIMIPDIPGRNGEPSTAEIYVNALRDIGLDVAGVHFHWMGSTVLPQDKGVTAVHHQKSGMHPIEFSIRTILSIEKAMKAIKDRS